MRTKSAARKEYIVFMNNDTLLYWHKLENFYPYILEEQHNEKIKSFKIARECIVAQLSRQKSEIFIMN